VASNLSVRGGWGGVIGRLLLAGHPIFVFMFKTTFWAQIIKQRFMTATGISMR
jgi:hypothetical protein